MIAVVKADAYGHGAVPIARMIQDYDYIWGYAVATEEEALSLREAGIHKPILVLGLVFPECMEELAKNDNVIYFKIIPSMGHLSFMVAKDFSWFDEPFQIIMEKFVKK